ncbi:type II toxin-antitoxin system BrnA family antitoxin [Aureimonas phyllosphaerae]|uniref:type II toxin-antitoxin system BrnA family antitoxin n=1 Tax=Aureimonas phyllosphaerae TaxID=1166078 RepID=UPI003A5C1D15
MKASDFDRAFDDGDDIEAYVDWSTGYRPNLDPQRLEVEFPRWMVEGLDRRAKTLGVKSEDLIKLWIAEKLS